MTASEASPLVMWTIYEGASDRPGPYTAREWRAWGGAHLKGCDAHDFPSLADARAFVSARMPRAICFPRGDCDDPCIVETWI